MERRTIGNVDVIALIDTVEAYPGIVVYPEAGEALSRFAHFMDSERKVALNFASFVLVEAESVVLVDTGWGPEHDGHMMDELRAANVAPGDIGQVIFTHLHGDHTGWNLDRATGQPLFPNARYLVPQADWDHYGQITPPPSSFVRDVLPLEAMGRMELFAGERALSSSLIAIPTPGHTPGHTSVVITSGNEHGMILGDVVISPIDAERPEWPNAFDWDAAIARTTRLKAIERLVESRALVGASHLPVPGFGRFVGRGGGTAWEPA